MFPIDQMDGEKHVLLSSLDETIIEKGKEFNLGIHKFEGDNYFPKGHKYVIDFEAETVAKTTYGVGSVVLVKESLLVEKEQQMLLRYTLKEAQDPIKIRFKPFLAFRNHHALSKANLYVNTKGQTMSRTGSCHDYMRGILVYTCNFQKSLNLSTFLTGIIILNI